MAEGLVFALGALPVGGTDEWPSRLILEQLGRALAFLTLIAASGLYALKMVRESGIRCGRVPNMVKNRAGSNVIA